MIQQTLAEELKFIHEHMEQVELRVDAINEELKALGIAMQRIASFLNRIADAIDNAGNNHAES